MRNVFLIALWIVIASLLSGWIPLLWFGIDSWLTGIQQQIDGSRSQNSFPFEAFGRSLVRWALIWAFVSTAGITFWCIQKRVPYPQKVG